MITKDLGEKVDLQKTAAEEDSWVSAEQADAEFVPVPKKERAPRKQKETKIVDKEITNGVEDTKASPQLRKFRELFGLQRVEVKYYNLTRRSQDGESNEYVKIGLRAMNFEDFQWCLEQTAAITQDVNQHIFINSEAIAQGFAWKQAVIAISVCSLDGVPIYEVFGMDKQDGDSNYPKLFVRIQAASLLLAELKTTLYDAVDELHDAILALVKSYDARIVEEAKDPLV